MENKEITPNEVAERTGANLQTVHRWLRTGKLKSRKKKYGLTYRYLIKEADFQAFYESHIKQRQ